MAGRMYALIEVPRNRNLSQFTVLPSIGGPISPRKKKNKSPRKNSIQIPTGWQDIRIVHVHPRVGRPDHWIQERGVPEQLFTVKETPEDRSDSTGHSTDDIKVLGEGNKKVSFREEVVTR